MFTNKLKGMRLKKKSQRKWWDETKTASKELKPFEQEWLIETWTV